MGLRINRIESLKKGRLIYHYTLWQKIDFIFDLVLYAIMPIAGIMVILNPRNNAGLITYCFVIVFSIYMAFAFWANYKLYQIEFRNAEHDRKLLVIVLKSHFPKLKINDNGKHMLVSKRETGLFNWGKRLTVIFDDSKAHINLITLGNFESKSPFHPIINYFKIKKIEKAIKLQQNANQYGNPLAVK